MSRFDSIISKCFESEKFKKQEQEASDKSKQILDQAILEAREQFRLNALMGQVTSSVIDLNRFTEHNMYLLFGHWNIYLASMVLVKHTIKLSEDYSVNHLFGLKKHRCHSSYNIFELYNSVGYPAYTDGQLKLADTRTVNLITLFKHKNVNQKKIPLLLELTNDICSLINDRKIILTEDARKAINFVKKINSNYNSSEFYEELKLIEKYHTIYFEVSGTLEAINDKRKMIETKWEDINKNYKLLIRLSNKELRT
ncbi:MAG: hypothetical protein KKF08_18950 [Gammaproteobacteria bacterium]|nr:hypothetical protein [Gammaproteobacteria bacterium]